MSMCSSSKHTKKDFGAPDMHQCHSDQEQDYRRRGALTRVAQMIAKAGVPPPSRLIEQ